LRKKTHRVLYPRIGHEIIINEVPERSRVLDLGCGDGVLLETLRDVKKVKGYGVEISEEGVSICLEKGLSCYQGDIDDGLEDFQDNSFDYVILNQTIQNIKKPEFVLQEILRIGLNAIISFPNFGYYRIRLHLMFQGTMPKNRLLPYEWYETPNIHLLSIKDFQNYCGMHAYPVKLQEHFSQRADGSFFGVRVMANLFAQYGMFFLDGGGFTRTSRGGPDG